MEIFEPVYGSIEVEFYWKIHNINLFNRYGTLTCVYTQNYLCDELDKFNEKLKLHVTMQKIAEELSDDVSVCFFLCRG